MAALKLVACVLLSPLYLAWILAVCVLMIVPMIASLTYYAMTGDLGPADRSTEFMGTLFTLGRDR